MLLIPIEGSRVAIAAGFHEGLIRVLFRGGRFADYPGRTREEFDELLASPSKGRFIHERLNATPIVEPAGNK